MSKYTEPPAESVSYQVTQSPDYEIITADELRYHIHGSEYEGDAEIKEVAYLNSLIKSAGDTIEARIRRPVRSQTCDLVLRRPSNTSGYSVGYSQYNWWGWCDSDIIRLDITPIRAVNRISYTHDGQDRTIADSDYTVDGLGEHITREVDIRFNTRPFVEFDEDIIISVDCGWTQANLPENLKHAAKIMAGDWYEMRHGVVMTSTSPSDRSVEFILDQYVRVV